MEYSFRPQWRQKKFSFPSCQRPVCGRCGNVHPNVLCFAFNQKCYRCHRIGHYSRMCFTQMKKPTKCVEKEAVLGRKKTRDMKRLCKYLENKPKEKIDAIKRSVRKTGGGPPPGPSLTPSEEALMKSLEGRPVSSGLPGGIDTDGNRGILLN
uniref:Uncharacterized protein n=1 Tax=Magallana gigas TaxID=29159 RepID=K1QAC4_MAGGI